MFYQLLTLLLLQINPLSQWQPKVEHIQQRRMEIAFGQYSGITRIGEDVYAVVHDKAKGGGLFIFTINMLPDGTIGTVHAFEVDSDGDKGRDNEDLVYVKETGTLFIASEADQSVREYSLDGKETGRQLRIPQEFTKNKDNLGFEALGYADGLFWTTTEVPLPDEDLHRLQSFHLSTLAPYRQYSYKADGPTVSESNISRAMAHVSGISAITALPRGKLLVLEREVYVPDGDFIEKMSSSFTLTSIYMVDPAHDKSSPLKKTLLTRFYTSAMNLANFEGMCLGPKLQDGRQTILLIADSQDGSKGLTGEYIRVIAVSSL